MKSILIQNKDLVLSSNKLEINNSQNALFQNIENSVRIHKNEWFNSDIGLDYLNWENLRLNDNQIIQSIATSLSRNKNILEITNIGLTRDTSNRILDLEISVKTVEGNLVITL